MGRRQVISQEVQLA